MALSSPTTRVRLAWALLVASTLSWLAIALTALDIVMTADVRREQGNGDSGD